MYRMTWVRRAMSVAMPLLLATALVAPSSAGAAPRRVPPPGGHISPPVGARPLASPVPSHWLAIFNYYRDLATPDLPDVIENDPGNPTDNFTYWDQWHSIYMVETQSGIDHQEDPANEPWYDAKGHDAAQNSNLAWISDITADAQWAIEGWMTAPFHGLQMLDPRLLETGFGIKHKNGVTFKTASGVDVSHDDDNAVPAGQYPIMWPGNDKTVYLDRYPGFESPDPLVGPCDHLTAPTGLPIYLLLGPGTEVHYGGGTSSFKQGTTELPFCAFDGDMYDGAPDAVGPGDALEELNAIFLLPNRPLKSEKQYNVDIQLDDGSHHIWDFRTGDLKPPKSKIKKPPHDSTKDQDKLEKIKGTSTSGDTARVDVAIGGLLPSGKCKFRKANGNFTGPRFCSSEQLWLKAKGKADWAYSIKGKLPPTFHPQRGQIYDFVVYLIYSRGQDEVENLETRFTDGRNKNAVHVTP